MSSCKKILLTGGTGLIGKETVGELTKSGFDVYALTIDEQIPADGVHWIHADIRDTASLNNIIQEIQPEYLLHLAWPSIVDLNTDEHDSFKNVSLRLLEIFKTAGGKRAVFTGSCFEYKFKNEALKETDETNPATAYARAKLDLLKSAEDYSRASGISFAWARIFYVFGKNEHPKRLTACIINGLKNNTPIVIQTAHLFKDYIYTKEIAGALSCLMSCDIRGIVNICSGTPVKVGDFAKTFAKQAGREALLELYEKQTDQPPLVLGDNTRLTKEAGYTFRYSFEDAVNDILKESLT